MRQVRHSTLLVALVSHAAVFAASSPDTLDPVEGKWWGTVVAPHETVETGFEFKRNAEGVLGLTITQPGANYFDMGVPGVVRRDGDRVVLDEILLTGTVAKDRITGKFGRAQLPFDLQRVATLPTLQPVPTLPTGPGPRWQTRLSGQIYAAPAVADGVAYVGTTGGVFNAVRTSDGSVAWTFVAGGPILGTARLADDSVFFTCDNGYLFKLERATGKETWRYDLGDARVPRVLPHPTEFGWDWHGPRPLWVDGVVYVGAGDGGFHAIDAASGNAAGASRPAARSAAARRAMASGS